MEMSSLALAMESLGSEERLARSLLYQSPPSVMVDMVLSRAGGVYLPRRFTEMAKRLKELELRSDDVFLISYPKAGSTWSQEMVWQIVNNFDLERGKQHVLARSPFLEITLYNEQEDGQGREVDEKSGEQVEEVDASLNAMLADGLEYVANMPSPRVIKTHLPLEFLPDNLLEECKVIWIARNVKDSVVSFYHHERLMPMFKYVGSFEQYAELFMQGKLFYGDYWHHLQQGWEARERANVKFIWYEEMKKDIRKVIRDLARFLHSAAFEDEGMVEKLADHLSFEKFRNNPAVNLKPPKETTDQQQDNPNFIRKGKVGDWKNYFQGETLRQWDEWIAKKNKLNIPFNFE